MKKLLSLLLAVLMVVALVPAAILSATAADTTTEYVAYEQDFEAIAAGTTGVDLLGALGWYVPDSKVDTNGATYSIVSIGTNKVLRVNTLDAEAESFVNIFGGEVMSILGRSDFTLSYRLTYRAETTDANGYASIIYNYNGLSGATVSETGNEAYGIVAVRMCGTGFNSVYYPATGSECAMHSLEKALGSANVMENGYDPAQMQSFVYGAIEQAEQEADDDGMISMPAVFNSWPLNPQDGVEDAPVNERGRLKFNADASDFFNEEGSAGVDASQRIKGIVLHDILANVSVPDDLDAAVEAAVVAGTLPAEDAQQVKEMLNGCICSVEAEGWFPEDRSCVMNEMELIDTDGKIYRPDRVVRYGDKILIVDYKFGEHHRKYERQLKRYADLWTRMGYNVESAKLWYVFTGEIVAVV